MSYERTVPVAGLVSLVLGYRNGEHLWTGRTDRDNSGSTSGEEPKCCNYWTRDANICMIPCEKPFKLCGEPVEQIREKDLADSRVR